ncbi:MAG: ATP-binding protein [Agathobacter sp.]|nr:ATP-binding protein [Agathobacter sp.]
MGDYKDTITWNKIYGNTTDNKEECDFLRVEYEKFRDNARLLAGEIASILPEYTVHDITHIDALWDMTDIFLPRDYSLSPIECFVLGGAFILHDLGMLLAAYPEGRKGIQKQEIWKDTVANLCKQRGLPYNFEELDNIDKDVDKIATEKTLRLLHGQKAKELAIVSWKDSNGKDIYLIDDKKLRDAYGTIIGKIAQSHWFYCEELPQEFPTVLGALSIFPETWTVDPLKLACILRIADAMHIDDRRAPSMLKAVREINRESELHWIFQEKLYKPRTENNRVVYTSKSAFGLSEIDAWWLCYDTLRMIDTELKNVDSLLFEQRREGFGVISVYGIDSLEQIQKFIAVDGWKPVDTCIRVNNVAKLVNTLGGVQLYGDNNWVPLRELIQNAADAIRARRCIDEEPDDYGDINLSWGEEDGKEFVQIEDNGIGMSPNVMVNVLLDFGQSFWSTPQMHNEFPGLEQKSFKSTGKFGIGFFSVFMWGENVKVISNRYDKARDNTMVLEFVNGVNSRPILRKANAEEVIRNGGTRIKIYLSKKSIRAIFEPDFYSTMDVEEMLAKMCFSLDCNLYINNDNKKLLVKANDWLSMGTNEFLQRLIGQKGIEQLVKEKSDVYQLLCNNITIIKEEDETIVGRACLLLDEKLQRRSAIMGTVTVDGFGTTELRGIIGVLKGNTQKASRDIAIPILSQMALDRWIEEQAKLMVSTNLSDEEQIEVASFACALSSKITELKIARWKDTYVNYSQIVEIVRKQKYEQYYLVHDAAVHIWERDEKKQLELADNVFACAMGCPGILQTGNVHAYVEWPSFRTERARKFGCAVVEKQVAEAIAEACNSSLDSMLEAIQFSDDDTEYSGIVGQSDDNNIEMRVDIMNINSKEG